MSRLSLVLFLLLLSRAVAVQGSNPKGPDTETWPVPAQDQPAVSDAQKDDGGKAVYGPRIVVTSVLGFLAAVIVVATAFFIYRKATGKPLDMAKLVRMFGRPRESGPQRTGDEDDDVENVAQPSPVSTEEGTL